jgi:hypothetical protein
MVPIHWAHLSGMTQQHLGVLVLRIARANHLAIATIVIDYKFPHRGYTTAAMKSEGKTWVVRP